jgi:hypothetical protein
MERRALRHLPRCVGGAPLWTTFEQGRDGAMPTTRQASRHRIDMRWTSELRVRSRRGRRTQLQPEMREFERRHCGRLASSMPRENRPRAIRAEGNYFISLSAGAGRLHARRADRHSAYGEAADMPRTLSQKTQDVARRDVTFDHEAANFCRMASFKVAGHAESAPEHRHIGFIHEPCSKPARSLQGDSPRMATKATAIAMYDHGVDRGLRKRRNWRQARCNGAENGERSPSIGTDHRTI